MKYHYGFFILLIIALVTGAGCTPAAPVGATGSGSGTPAGAIDSLLVVPHRSLYSVNDVLMRGNDFSAFAHYSNNTIAKIPADQVGIGIIEDLGSPDTVTPVPPENNHYFISEGTKGVVVTYDNISAQYTVQVLDPFDIGGSTGGSGGNGPGIVITW
jgi:hypothetical protein